jgi:hypothetical protein
MRSPRSARVAAQFLGRVSRAVLRDQSLVYHPSIRALKKRALLPMDRLFPYRHARNLLAGIQEGRRVDSRLRIAGMTEDRTEGWGSLTQQTSQRAGPVLGMNGLAEAEPNSSQALDSQLSTALYDSSFRYFAISIFQREPNVRAMTSRISARS